MYNYFLTIFLLQNLSLIPILILSAISDNKFLANQFTQFVLNIKLSDLASLLKP